MSRITLLDLLDPGLLQPGERLVSSHRDAADTASVIDDGGRVKVTGQPPDASPSAAAERVLGRKYNGWAFWRVQRPEGLVKLDDLRRGLTVPPTDVGVVSIPLERQHTLATLISRSAEPSLAERSEHALVVRFARYLRSRGVETERLEITPPGEASLFCDVYIPERNQLIEAKAAASRESIRMAIGELADYAYLMSTRPKCASGKPSCAVLLPQQPRPSLESLLDDQRLAAIWPTDAGFADSAGGHFT